MELTPKEQKIIEIYRTNNPTYTIPINVVLETYEEEENNAKSKEN